MTATQCPNPNCRSDLYINGFCYDCLRTRHRCTLIHEMLHNLVDNFEHNLEEMMA